MITPSAPGSAWGQGDPGITRSKHSDFPYPHSLSRAPAPRPLDQIHVGPKFGVGQSAALTWHLSPHSQPPALPPLPCRPCRSAVVLPVLHSVCGTGKSSCALSVSAAQPSQTRSTNGAVTREGCTIKRGTMAPIVYVDFMSPCAQAVALTKLAAPGLESVTFKELDLPGGEALKPEFVKKFPLHAIPALEDDGFYLWDSHAICTYLLSAYAKDDKLYPKNDHKKRAKIDQWLHFCNSILYTRLRDLSAPIMMRQSKEKPAWKQERVGAALEDLEKLLGDKKWLCGDEMTLADICMVCEFNCAPTLYGDTSKFKVLHAWLARCRAAMPGFDEYAVKGSEKYQGIVNSLTSS